MRRVVLSIAAAALLSGCRGTDDGRPGGSASPTQFSASNADAILQLRPVEALGSDLPLTCEASAPCSSDLLLDPQGITLAGPEDLRYRLGDLLVSGSDVAEATVVQGLMGDEGDDWEVDVSLTKEATAMFGAATRAVLSEPPPRNQIAVVVDGAVLFAPTVVAPIENGTLVISGLSQSDANDLAERLNKG